MIEAASLIGVTEPLILAVDNGATNTRLQVRHGDIVERAISYATPHDYDEAIGQLVLMTARLTDNKAIQSVGFAMAGEVADGEIIRAGQLQKYGWCARPFSKDVAQTLGVEEAAIILLNDCVAAAKAQQVANRKTGDSDSGYVETISTGFGGAGFRGDELIADEPGHQFLRAGAKCGCGNNGCAEAYISGSGIERVYGVPAEALPVACWAGIIEDAVEAHQQMLERFAGMGFEPSALHLFGSVALKSPYLLPGLKAGLTELSSELPFLTRVQIATYRDDSGLVGAGDAALELMTS